MSTIGRVASGAAMGALLGGGSAGALAAGAGELIGAPLMASWKSRNEVPQQNVDQRGNVFLENGFGTIPQTPPINSAQADASEFIPQAGPVIPSRSTIQSNLQPLAVETAKPTQSILKETKPTQTVSDETSRAVSASKSLFPDER